MFKNKKLLITGGTGSFGNAVLTRLLNTKIKEIRIFSRDEKKQDDMRHRLNNPKVRFYIGDVRDKRSIDGAMMGVDYVFHAAALKQVPSCEFFPIQAVRTNVYGTENVLDSAIQHGLKTVVILSTDKAAYYHIGSGEIESANKMICHGRLKRTGAWWYPSCANNVLKLRCAKYNGTYDRVIELYRERHPITAVRTRKKQGSPTTDTDL